MEKRILFSLTKKDFEFTFFKSSGGGGQHRNKNATAARCIHRPSMAIGEGKEEKSRSRNIKNAFNRCVNSNKFKAWMKLEIARKTGELSKTEKQIEKRVEEMLKPENLKIEYL